MQLKEVQLPYKGNILPWAVLLGQLIRGKHIAVSRVLWLVGMGDPQRVVWLSRRLGHGRHSFRPQTPSRPTPPPPPALRGFNLHSRSFLPRIIKRQWPWIQDIFFLLSLLFLFVFLFTTKGQDDKFSVLRLKFLRFFLVFLSCRDFLLLPYQSLVFGDLLGFSLW